MKEVFVQSLRFGAVGTVNSVIGLSAIWLGMWAGLAPLAANAVGYAIGISISFALNRFWTFGVPQKDNAANSPTEIIRFGLSFAASYSLNLFVVWLGLELTEVSPHLLQVFGMVTFSISFFVLCRAWVFTNSSE